MIKGKVSDKKRSPNQPVPLLGGSFFLKVKTKKYPSIQAD